MLIRTTYTFILLTVVNCSLWAVDSKTDSSLYYLNAALGRGPTDSILVLINKGLNQPLTLDNQEIYSALIFRKGVEYHVIQQMDSAKHYLDLALEKARSVNLSDSLKAKIYYQYSNYLCDYSEFVTALSYMDSSFLSVQLTSDSLMYADVYNRFAIINDNLGRRTESVEWYLKAKAMYDILGYNKDAVSVDGNLAIIYNKIGDWESAMSHYNAAIEKLTEMDEMSSVRVNQINRGLLFKNMGDFEAALADLYEAMHFFQRDGWMFAVALTQHNIAETHFAQGELDSAVFYTRESQKNANRDNPALVINNYGVLAKVLQKQGRFKESNRDALKAYELAKDKQLPEELLNILKTIYVNYQELRQFENAFNYHKELKMISDSLADRKSRQQLDQLRTHHELSQKESKIAQLESESDIQKSLAEKERKLNMALILGISLLISFLLVLFILYFRQMRLSSKLNLQKQQLADLNSEKDRLVAMVAHDLRSPLNNIWGLLGLIRKDAQDEETGRLLDMATQSANILRSRINLILDVKAINAGKLNLRIDKVEVSDVMKILEYNISADIRDKHMNLLIDKAPRLYCQADESYLLQILENLCTNAIKYSPKKSKIEVSAIRENGSVLFKVKDEGQGIPEEEQKNLFTENSQISTVPTDHEKSTGLGLVIVKKYVEAMKGEVWYEGQSGVGSTFVLKLPASDN